MNPLRFATLVAIAIAGFSVAADVVAQASPPASAADSPLYFPNVDKNHDGSVSRSEVPKELAALRTHFDEYDLDHNHRLSEAEYVAFLSTYGEGACRENDHTSVKCASSPYSMTSRTMGVSPDNAPKVARKQGQ